MAAPPSAVTAIRLLVVAVLLTINAAACVVRGPDATREFAVFRDGTLAPGLDVGVDSCPRQANWVGFGGEVDIALPAGARWGAVTFLFGLDDPRARLTEDLSGFDAVRITAAGDWGVPEDGGLAVDIAGLRADEVQSPAGCEDRAASPPNRDLVGRTCWLRPAAEGAFTTFTIPLGYFERMAGESISRSAWSPAQLVVGPNLSDGPRPIHVREIVLLPKNGSVRTPCEERCAADCLNLEEACRALCGAT